MDVPQGKQRSFPAVATVLVLLVLCVVPGQFLVAKQFPAIAGQLQFSPSLVFLDIPVPLPVTIDLVVVPVLFFLLYALVLLFSPARRQLLPRLKAAFTGLFVLLLCTLAGGLIYYLVQSRLTTQVLTGINSMGINAALHLPYKGYETIQVRGSLIVLVSFLTGLFIFIRKIRKAPAAGLTREQRMSPYKRMLQERRMQAEQPKKNGTMETPRVNIQADRNRQSGLCFCPPVIRFRPEALYYMPVGN